MTTIAIADDHPTLRAGLKQALEAAPDITVSAEVGTGPELFALLAEAEPDVLMLDISMPDFKIFEAIPQLRSDYPDMKILIVSATDDAVHIRRLAGVVDGYLFKGEAMDHFALAVQRVCVGETYFSPHIVSKMISGMEDEIPGPHLSPREIEVLEWAAKGATSAEIAQKLCISERTVTTHMTRIYKKLSVRGRAAAVARAIELGYFSTL